MARYSSSSSSYSQCFSSRSGYGSYEYAQYACIVIFLAVYLGILVTLCIVRKKAGQGKHLIGLPYIFALFFMFLEQFLRFIWTTLSACRIAGGLKSSYDWQNALLALSFINTILLLFVVIYTLNTMLRNQLGRSTAMLKVTLGIDLAVLGLILLTLTIMSIYALYWVGRSLSMDSPSNLYTVLNATIYLGLAFDAVTLLSVLGSGALAFVAARSLKKKHIAGASLMIWIAILTLSLFAYSLISIILTALSLADYNYQFSNPESRMATYWLSSLFRALAFIAVIVIARNSVWKSKTSTGHTVDHHAYSTVEQPHTYDYRQPPVAYGGAGQHA